LTAPCYTVHHAPRSTLHGTTTLRHDYAKRHDYASTIQGTTTTCDIYMVPHVKINTGKWPSEGALVPKQCRHLTGWTNCLHGDSCRCAHRGSDLRAARAERWDVNDLSIYLWPDEPTAKLMTAASVLTGGAEPRGVAVRTYNVSICL
jgi:hypothetical protein